MNGNKDILASGDMSGVPSVVLEVKWDIKNPVVKLRVVATAETTEEVPAKFKALLTECFGVLEEGKYPLPMELRCLE